MTRLLRVELARLRWRRAVVVLLLAAVVVPALVTLSVIWDTRPPDESAVAFAEQQAVEDASRAYVRRDLARCQRTPQDYLGEPVPDDVEAACRDAIVPSAEWYLSTPVLDLDEQRVSGSSLAVAALLGVFMFVVGATYAGHDWATGAIGNLLLMETRRLRVWTAKALAVLLVTGVAAGVVMTAYWLTLCLVAGARDLPTDGALVAGLQQAARVAGLAAVGGLAGFGLTMLLRNTVATISLLFGVAVAGGLVLATLGPDDTGWIDPSINALAVVTGEFSYYVSPGDGSVSGEVIRTAGEGAVYFGVLLAVLLAVSAVAFRRRDVG